MKTIVTEVFELPCEDHPDYWELEKERCEKNDENEADFLRALLEDYRVMCGEEVERQLKNAEIRARVSFGKDCDKFKLVQDAGYNSISTVLQCASPMSQAEAAAAAEQQAEAQAAGIETQQQ